MKPKTRSQGHMETAANLCTMTGNINWLRALNERRSWLSTVIYARVKDPHAVEEVLQETALAAARHGSEISDQDGINRWLYRVAIRQSLLYRRNQSRRSDRLETYSQQANGSSSAKTNEPLSLILLSEQKGLVQKAMSQLRSRDYEILMLKYAEDWSCRELASRLEVNLDTIKSRLLRARKNLRRELLKLEKDWEPT